jgi:hypothetical protein
MTNPLDGKTYIEKLVYMRDQALDLLASVRREGPKPTYTINGQEVEWMEYQEMLQKEIKGWNEQIAAGDPDDEPFEILSQGVSL